MARAADLTGIDRLLVSDHLAFDGQLDDCARSELGGTGGRIAFEGTPAELVAARSTLTGQHLADYVRRCVRMRSRPGWSPHSGDQLEPVAVGGAHDGEVAVVERRDRGDA